MLLRVKISLAEIFLLFVCLQSSTAVAEESAIQIISGGPTSQKYLAPQIPEMEKIAGARITLKVAPIAAGMQAIKKGLVDGAVSGDFAEIEAVMTKAGLPKPMRDDYQDVKIFEAATSLGVSSENPIKSLSKQQITEILTGKIKSWEPLTGEKIPITIVLPSNYQATVNQFLEFYISGAKPENVRTVLDKDGLFKAMQADKGAIGVFAVRESSPTFQPKFLDTDVKRPVILYMKNPPRPAARKLFEYLKSKGPTRVE